MHVRIVPILAKKCRVRLTRQKRAAEWRMIDGGAPNKKPYLIGHHFNIFFVDPEGEPRILIQSDENLSFSFFQHFSEAFIRFYKYMFHFLYLSYIIIITLFCWLSSRKRNFFIPLHNGGEPPCGYQIPPCRPRRRWHTMSPARL